MGPKYNIYTKLAILLIMLTFCAAPGLGMVTSMSRGDGDINDPGGIWFWGGLGVGGSILLAILGYNKDRQDGRTRVNEFDQSDPFYKEKRSLSVAFFLFIAVLGCTAAVIPWQENMQRIGLLVGVAGIIATIVQIVRNNRSSKRDF